MARGRGYGQRRSSAPQGRGRGRGLGKPAPRPWDSTAQRESGELGNEGADARASLAANFADAQNQLGFGVGARNPYSRMAENQEALDTNLRGITTAAGNQLYAGSTLNARSGARSEFDKNQKALEDRIASEQGDFTRGVAQTGREEASGRLAIGEGAIKRAAATEPAPLAPGRGRGRGRGKAGLGPAPIKGRRGRGRY